MAFTVMGALSSTTTTTCVAVEILFRHLFRLSACMSTVWEKLMEQKLPDTRWREGGDAWLCDTLGLASLEATYLSLML